MTTLADVSVPEGLDTNPVQGLHDALGARLARQTQDYDSEYGLRLDDAAMVLHFYPPQTNWTKYPPQAGKWPGPVDRDGVPVGISTRLERALAECFKPEDIKASYSGELRSFCIVLRGIGESPDPMFFVNRFFDAVDRPL